MASAAKRADRETTEGVVLTRVDDGAAAIVADRLRDRAGLEERGLPRVRPGRCCEAVYERGEEAAAELEERAPS